MQKSHRFAYRCLQSVPDRDDSSGDQQRVAEPECCEIYYPPAPVKRQVRSELSPRRIGAGKGFLECIYGQHFCI